MDRKTVKAYLKKHVSDDGCFVLYETVPLGKEYDVYPDSRKLESGFNTDLCKRWYNKEFIEDALGGWLPVELLDIPSDK